MSETSLLLQDIVEVSHEGVEFYEAAAKATTDKTLSGVFTKLAKAKQDLVENLATSMKPRKAGKHVMADIDALTGTYAAGRGKLKNAPASYITALEKTETMLQQSLHEVLFDRSNDFVVRVYAKQYIGATEQLKAQLRNSVRRLCA